MKYTPEFLRAALTEARHWDVREWLNQRQEAFIKWAATQTWDSEDRMYDLLRRYEQINPRFPSKELRRRVFSKYDACTSCGSTEKLCIDHIIPYSKGGWTKEENLTVLCRTCNSRKHAKLTV